MKHKFLIPHSSFLIAAAAALLLTACTAKTPKLETMEDTLSWAMGENVGRSILTGNAVEIDHEVFMQAIEHTLKGKEQPISDTVYMQAIQFIMGLSQKSHMEAAQQAEAATDSAQAAYFAELEKRNPNVIRHPSGFYYEVLRQGKGPNAKFGQRIKFDYRSYLLLTGEAFDQTYGKRNPILHVVAEPMFPGLIDAFQLMNAGSLYRFYFPYQLVFGANGSGSVPGYTPMIYEIELHELYKD